MGPRGRAEKGSLLGSGCQAREGTHSAAPGGGAVFRPRMRRALGALSGLFRELCIGCAADGVFLPRGSGSTPGPPPPCCHRCPAPGHRRSCPLRSDSRARGLHLLAKAPRTWVTRLWKPGCSLDAWISSTCSGAEARARHPGTGAAISASQKKGASRALSRSLCDPRSSPQALGSQDRALTPAASAAPVRDEQ